MSDTDRVVLGKRKPVEVLRHKLPHQQTSPDNAMLFFPPYMYTRLSVLKEKTEDISMCYLLCHQNKLFNAK